METQMVLENQGCFVSILDRLRESSKDAVASADMNFNDPYFRYMHVCRPVQDKFVSILEKTYDSDQAELILLCGNVGDGKSHMLSYCKYAYPDKMDKFYIHNDSTASLYIDKPASYTLMKVMEDFADDKIDRSKGKVILAINLGTLSNFLEADEGHRFKRLRQYVEQTGILDETIENSTDHRHFHSVNFTDYHLYELSKDGISSDYIHNILKKITDKNDENPFYQAYCNTCQCCQNKSICPININYRLLSDEKIQQGLICALVENIIKNKLIVSTRALLNMIYEILVDEKYWQRGSLEPRKEPERITRIDYCRALLPNVLFSRKNSSEVLNFMGSIDPMRIRNEKIDDFFVYYENTDETLSVFKRILPGYSYQMERFSNTDFSDRSMYAVKEAVLRLLVRTCFLVKADVELLPADEDYEEYVRALYAWNTGDSVGLRNVQEIVKKGVLSWNGQVRQDEMQLEIGNKKSGYHLIQKIEIKKKSDNLPNAAAEQLCSFRDELKLKYLYAGGASAELDVDFSLYKLLKKVANGYVPNINDKRVNVKCMEFVNLIARGGKKMEQLYIRDLSQKAEKAYRLTYDEDMERYFFEVAE